MEEAAAATWCAEARLNTERDARARVHASTMPTSSPLVCAGINEFGERQWQQQQQQRWRRRRQQQLGWHPAERRLCTICWACHNDSN